MELIARRQAPKAGNRRSPDTRTVYPLGGERPGRRPVYAAMKPPMTDEDRELDALWRARFGEPMPILGAADIVRALLGLHDPSPPAAAAA